MTRILEEVAPNLWHVEQHHHAGPVHVRVRMVVVRLETGELWLHSPVELTEDLVAELAELGGVAHIVAPSHGHTKWASAAKSTYPQAMLWGAPGLGRAKPSVPIDEEIVAGTSVPWSSSLSTCVLQGNPKNSEVVFVHRAARTLICTDLVINISSEPSLVTRGLYWSIGVWKKLATPRLWRKRTVDLAAARASFDELLEQDFDTILMAHGDPVRSGGKARLREALCWAT